MSRVAKLLVVIAVLIAGLVSVCLSLVAYPLATIFAVVLAVAINVAAMLWRIPLFNKTPVELATDIASTIREELLA